jgi:hypothetical protein
MLKLYIAVLDQVPDHMVPVLVSHAVLGAHLAFCWRPDRSPTLDYEEWLDCSFRKCVVKVNEKEFEKMRALPSVYEAHENTTLGGKKSCLVLAPREEWPNVVKFAKLWKPNAQLALDKIPNEVRFHYDA